jgi:hypothetical protein
MQIGEPVAVVPVATPPPDAELEAEIVAITFKSKIKVSHGRALVEGPHWEKGKEGAIEDVWSRLARLLHLPAAPYSKRPAVFVAGGLGGPYDVEVKLRITKSRRVSGDARLVGTLRGVSIEGTCGSGVGDHTVRAVITNPPEDLTVCRGRIAWTLRVDADAIVVSLGTTFVEIYFILGAPSVPYRKHGVWVEVLRFLFGHIGVSGNNRWAVIATITAYCHGGHGLRYETNHGTAKYGVGHEGGAFSLRSYLWRGSALCNCYDQAAAVQALAGAIGVNSAWLFLEPFGYIRPTNLVGVGWCNSPFFGDNEKLKLVPPDSEKRTGFGNHAFAVTYGAMTVDACAKPHLATETVPEYLADSIDDTESLYDRGFRPGRPRDVLPKIGVVSVK